MSSNVYHLKQAKHNANFLQSVENQWADAFFDWKITLKFYVALHFMRAWVVQKGVIVPLESHFAFHKELNPSNAQAKCPLPKPIFDAYYLLYAQSRQARYEGFISSLPVFNREMRSRYQTLVLPTFQTIETFLKKEGVSI